MQSAPASAPALVTPLRDRPALAAEAARFFSGIWGIPLEAYEESMAQCLAQQKLGSAARGVPQWYVILDEAGNIAGGAGVIENDFHARRDLAPNVCAVYVNKALRGRGMARGLLDFIRLDMAGMGIATLYLLTSHTEFYEKCGWEFLTTAQCDGGEISRVYVAHTKIDTEDANA